MDKPPLSWLPWEGLIKGKSSKSSNLVQNMKKCTELPSVGLWCQWWLGGSADWICVGHWLCCPGCAHHQQKGTHRHTAPFSDADLHIHGWVIAWVMAGGWHEEKFKAVLRAMRSMKLVLKALGWIWRSNRSVSSLFPSLFKQSLMETICLLPLWQFFVYQRTFCQILGVATAETVC